MKRVINFMGIRHAAFVVTVLLTLVSLGSLAVKGLNFGLDFTGGALIELNYEQPADLAKVRGQLAEAGYGDALVQRPPISWFAWRAMIRSWATGWRRIWTR